MKIKTLLNLTAIFFLITLIACDDTIDSVGESIQPKGDDIFVGADTVLISAKTISLKDSIYARSSSGSLGTYTDPIFGEIKSDYLAQFYCPLNTTFDKKTLGIDSISLTLGFISFLGDSISPIGISAYRLNESLKANFFTNIKPEKYCDMKTALGQNLFTIQSTPITKDPDLNVKGRFFKIKMDKQLGDDFYNEWVRSNGATFSNPDSFNEFFKGMYITSTFGSTTLANIAITALKIHYRYTGRNIADTSDSIHTSTLKLEVTPEVIQINHVKNSTPENLLADNQIKTYLKSPAGLATELTIPLKEIINKVQNKGGKNSTLNGAEFKLVGFTEDEVNSTLSRPSLLLFVNKDSLNTFFLNKERKTNAKTSFIMGRSSLNNSYAFISNNIQGNYTTNIASLINHYADLYKNNNDIPDLKYLVIPITADVAQRQTSGGQVIYVYTNIYNQMFPTSAIFRTDSKNMKMPLVISKYKE